MDLAYILGKKTGGANPFKIFESLEHRYNQESLAFGIKRMEYKFFLETAYWFAVSSVAKARAGMRCNVCNCADRIQVHHRTYDNHGYEHKFMSDLVVLCDNCHGLFHGHQPVAYKRPRLEPKTTTKVNIPRGFTLPHSDQDLQMPDGDPIVLTKELIAKCRANGSFTNATLVAFGLTSPLVSGWAGRLIGQGISRDNYLAALKGRFIYRSKLPKPSQPTNV